MKRGFVTAAAGPAVFLAFAAAAYGVQPKKGATYVGDIKSSPFAMHISMAVRPDGKAQFTYLCGTGRAPTTVRGIVIDAKGYFKFTSNPATGQDWKLAGHFVTPTSAFVSLNSVSCGGSKGSTTIKLKP
jgi:hypothetical protein